MLISRHDKGKYGQWLKQNLKLRLVRGDDLMALNDREFEDKLVRFKNVQKMGVVAYRFPKLQELWEMLPSPDSELEMVEDELKALNSKIEEFLLSHAD